MKKSKIIPVILLASVVLFAGIAWVIAKAPVTSPVENEITPETITMERILAANHPSTLLRYGGNFLLKFDGEEKYQCFVEDGVVLKENAAGDKSSLIVDREYVVTRQGEEYDTLSVAESGLDNSWYANLVLNTSLLLKESIVSTAKENGDLIVTTTLSGEDYDNHYNRAVRSTASCTTVYTLDSTSCRVKSVTQTATQSDGTNIVSTLTLTKDVQTPDAVSTMSLKSTYTATENSDEYKLDKDGNGEINILFIGNSYSFYWTDELYALLNKAGYGDTNLNICDLYRSGADFIDHWESYEKGISDFTLLTVFNGNGEDRHDPNTRIRRKEGSNDSIDSLVYALSYKNWDVISFQQGNDNSQSETGHRSSIEKHFPLLYDLATSYHPNAIYYWQQDWPHEYFDNESKSLEAVQTFRKVGLEICREYDLINTPLGDAWQIVQHDSTFYKYDKAISTEEPQYSLHSRLWHHSTGSTKNLFGLIYEGDNSHDGDVGGGQYLNACVWFEMLTKTRVQDTAAADYIPVYKFGTTAQQAQGAYYIGLRSYTGEYARVATLTPELEAAVLAAQTKLQNAAHTAVVASYGEEYFLTSPTNN